jgi:hypothetical protein
MRYVCILTILAGCAACNRQHSATAAGSKAEPVEAPATQAVMPADPSTPSEAPMTGEPADAAANAVPLATIPAGTRIRVRLGQSLDTKYSRRGERFVAYLDTPVAAGNRVVLPKGTAFRGHVVEARSSGRLKGRAELGVTLDSFSLNGATYEIATASDLRASRSHKRRNFAIIGGGSGAGAAIGAIAGGGVGALIGAGAGAAAGTTGAYVTGKKHVRLPAETPLSFTLHPAVTLRG